jgi:Fe-Mn family superoxide dismutase
MLSRRLTFVPAFSFGAARFYTALPDLKKPKGAPATLPTLEFDQAVGVPPVISPRQLELHYTRHHKAYVDNFNKAAKDTYDGLTFEDIMKKTVNNPAEKFIFNQAAQHFNHSFYWRCLAPNGTAMPKDLEAAIVKAFGSVDAFKEQFEAEGMKTFGSGWAWLVYDKTAKTLKITQSSNAASPATDDNLATLFTIDVWEHAYYKDYENKRADYLKEVWRIVNWEFVASNLKRAQQ